MPLLNKRLVEKQDRLAAREANFQAQLLTLWDVTKKETEWTALDSGVWRCCNTTLASLTANYYYLLVS